MLKNYIKIAWRNLQARKGYALINIVGLSVGLAACLLIGLYVQDELSYDKFHTNADRTYRVLREFDIPDLQTTISYTPSALAPSLEDNLPGVEKAVRILQSSPVVEYGTKKFVEPSFMDAEEGFFELFSYPVIQGEATLGQPSTIVITEEMVTKYFAGENPIGKVLRVGTGEFEVTGVIANIPENSHLQFDFVAALDEPDLNWGRNNFITYLQLREGQSKEMVTRQIGELIKANTDPEGKQVGNGFIPHLQPITGIHLGQGVSVDIGSEGNILYVYLFMALAVFIVLLASINFTNLATARSTERAREVGMRKTLGAGRMQIALQFLGESVMISLMALLLAFAICQLTLPLLNNLADKSLDLETLYNGIGIIAIIGFTLLVGLAAGLYPALVLSRFEPSRAVKGNADAGRGDYLRKGLVVFQFTVSISLLVATGVIYKQLQFMRSVGLGFEDENVVLIERANFLGTQTTTFKQQLVSLPGVEHVTSGFSMPGTFFINSMWQPSVPDAEAQNIDYSFVDFDYIETLDIEMIAGRSFSIAYSTDSAAAIINEAASRDFGWTPEEAIGKQLTQPGRTFTIVGVAKDFHYRSLHSEIYPLALFGPQRSPRYIAVRINPNGVPNTLAAIQSTWKEFSDLPFEYAFLADDLAQQYQAESRLVKVFSVFAALAILIGCMGLFGLAAFMASKRIKEIGIRKVLGATVTGIIGLLSKDFLKLVAFGFVLAVPMAWFAMSNWLANFAYRTEIGPGIFLLAGAAAFLIAFATVSWQSIRTALTNPVESLKSE